MAAWRRWEVLGPWWREPTLRSALLIVVAAGAVVGLMIADRAQVERRLRSMETYLERIDVEQYQRTSRLRQLEVRLEHLRERMETVDDE